MLADAESVTGSGLRRRSQMALITSLGRTARVSLMMLVVTLAVVLVGCGSGSKSNFQRKVLDNGVTVIVH